MSISELPPWLLEQLDRADLNGPKYKRLFSVLQQAILSGQLPANTRLPASRLLAAGLNMSRNTVKSCYEMLHAEGYIYSRQGDGSYVTPQAGLVSTDAHIQPSCLPPELSEFAKRLDKPNRMHSSDKKAVLLPAMPDLSMFPWRKWQTAVGKANRKMQTPLSTSLQGELALREQIIQQLQSSRGIKATADNVIICSGSQQAAYLTMQMIANPGDSILVEDPGFPGIDGAIEALGANTVAVPIDEQGIQLNEAVEAMDSAVAAVITPSRNYPLGYTLSLSRRVQLLDWARSQNRWIIEDDYDSDFCFDHAPISALQGLDSAQRVIYMGTFTRSLHPSIRLGYLILPDALVKPFTNARQYLDGGLAQLPQLALAEFMSSGDYASHIRRMRKLYRQRRDLLHHMMNIELGGKLMPVKSDGGMHSVFLLPMHVDDQALARQAQKQGLGIRSLSHYRRLADSDKGIVIGFAGYSESVMHDAVKRLALLVSPLLS